MKKEILYLLSIIILLSFSSLLFSQELSEKQRWKKAESFLLYDNFEEALKIFNELNEKDDQNYNLAYKIGYCLVSGENIQDVDSAIKYLTLASQNITKSYKNSFRQKKAPVATYYYLGVAYRLNKEYSKAIDAFLQYKDLLTSKEKKSIKSDFVDREIQTCRDAMEIFDEHYMKLEQIVVEGLEDPSVRCPILCYDAQRLIFTNGKYNIFPPDINWDKDYSEGPFDKVYMAKKRENGVFYDPYKIYDDLKIPFEYIPVTATSDGSELYLIVDKYDNGEIWMSKFENGKYQPANPVKELNTNKWESHATITADGKRIYFTSMRKGGYGGLDIWYSDRDENGKWIKPVNMGTVINTEFHEEMPYIMRNGNALYFSSEGHTNVGGFDVFYSNFDEETQSWSNPINLGYPFSTSGNDMGYVVENTPIFAFCPVNDNKRRIDMDECDCINLIDEKAPMLANIKGIITLDPELEELLLKIRVKLIDANTGEEIANVPLNNDGSYSFENIKAGDYKIVAYADDQDLMALAVTVPQNESWNITEMDMTIDTRPYIAENIEDKPIVQNNTNESSTSEKLIKNVVFAKNSFEVIDEFNEDLKTLADYLKNNNDIVAEINGFSSKYGEYNYNIELSQKRAESVKEILISYGVNELQLKTNYYGWDNPLAINDYPDSRIFNQRAEINLNKKNAGIYAINVYVPTYYRENKNIDYEKGKYFYSERKIFTELVVENVFFDFDKYDIKPIYYENLDFIASYLKSNPNSKIKLVGHTDYYGSVEYNMVLSQNRVNAVANYLIDKGVNKSQLELDYKGEHENITVQTSDDTIRRLNRRVIISVIIQGVPPIRVAPIEVPEEYRIK